MYFIPYFSIHFFRLGWITPVKSQGSCGSCVAFAINAAAEAAMIKAGADLDSTDLSEQWLLNCSPYGDGNYGCDGAVPKSYAKWLPTPGKFFIMSTEFDKNISD